jgi:hypothetical protein
VTLAGTFDSTAEAVTLAGTFDSTAEAATLAGAFDSTAEAVTLASAFDALGYAHCRLRDALLVESTQVGVLASGLGGSRQRGQRDKWDQAEIHLLRHSKFSLKPSAAVLLES